MSSVEASHEAAGRVAQEPARPARSRKLWDIVLSIVLLVLSYSVFLLGALFALFSLAFIDYCPASSCSTADATTAQVTTGVVLAVIALLATALTIVLLVVRRRGWWVAAASLLIMVVGWIVGFLLWAVAVDG